MKTSKKSAKKPVKPAVQNPSLRAFNLVKKYVLKQYPNAKTIAKIDGPSLVYTVVDSRGKTIIDPQLLLPPARTVKKAWENAKYSIWFLNKLQKSRIQDEQKIYKTLAKEA
jgi:hypothetical protein